MKSVELAQEPGVISRFPGGPDGDEPRPAGGVRHTAVVNRSVLVPITPVTVAGTAPTTGPELAYGDDGTTSATFPDVSTADLTWYVPALSVLAPSPGEPLEQSPFSFAFKVSGHDAHGAPVIDATITVSVQRAPVDAAVSSLAAGATGQAVPFKSLTMSLVVPFRDSQSGQPTSTSVPMTTLTPTAAGWTATFELTGDLARAAYGSLSTAGYQDQPSQLSIGFTFDTKQRRTFFRGIPFRPVTDQNDALAPSPSTLDGAAISSVPLRMSAVQTSGLLARAGADRGALLRVDPDSQTDPERSLLGFGWRTVSLNRSVSLPVFVACRDFGPLYVDTTDPDHPRSVGCQDAIALGTAPSRLYSIMDERTTDDYTVFASTNRPSVYLLLPRRYRVGRIVPGSHPGMADYSPAIRWVQAFDATHDTQLPCQLQATLVPDIAPAAVVELVGALSAGQPAGSAVPTVLLPTSSGSGLCSLTVPSWNSGQSMVTSIAGDGIQFVAAMAWNDAVVFNANLGSGSTAELVGNANFALTDGQSLPIVELHVGIDDVCGPWPTGPVVVTAVDTASVSVQNNASGVATVDRVLAAQPDGSCIALATSLAASVAPGAQITVPLSTGSSTDATLVASYSIAAGSDAVSSQRVFLEDLHMTVTVINDLRWSDAGLSQVDLAVRLDTDTQAMNLTMTPGLPFLQVDIVQPLAGDRATSDNLLHVTRVTHDLNGVASAAVDIVVDLTKGVLVSLTDLVTRGS